MAKLESSNKKISDTLNAIRKFQGSYSGWKSGDAKAVIDSATATRAAFDAASGAVVSALGNFIAKSA